MGRPSQSSKGSTSLATINEGKGKKGAKGKGGKSGKGKDNDDASMSSSHDEEPFVRTSLADVVARFRGPRNNAPDHEFLVPVFTDALLESFSDLE